MYDWVPDAMWMRVTDKPFRVLHEGQKNLRGMTVVARKLRKFSNMMTSFWFGLLFKYLTPRSHDTKSGGNGFKTVEPLARGLTVAERRAGHLFLGVAVSPLRAEPAGAGPCEHGPVQPGPLVDRAAPRGLRSVLPLTRDMDFSAFVVPGAIVE